jgi:hypothetical protein
MEVQEVSFANEKARIAWEIGQRVSELGAELPVETPSMDTRTICFDIAHRTRGTYAVLLAGTVVGTAEVGVFVVPERTLTVLRKLGIPYHVR